MNNATALDRIMAEAMKLAVHRAFYEKAPRPQVERFADTCTPEFRAIQDELNRLAGEVMRQEKVLVDTVMKILEGENMGRKRWDENYDVRDQATIAALIRKAREDGWRTGLMEASEVDYPNDMDMYSNDYCNGWNACRDAILALAKHGAAKEGA